MSRQVAEVSGTAQSLVPPAIPIIMRSTEFSSSPKAKIAEQLGKLVASGGKRIVVQDTDWRTMLAMQSFRQLHSQHPQFHDWLLQSRPLSQLKSLQDLFGSLDAPAVIDPPNPPEPPTAPRYPPEVTSSTQTLSLENSSSPQEVHTDSQVRLGHLRSRAADSVLFEPNSLKRHAAFLGGTGSGKTTAALNLIEQLLLHGVPALLIDRKGDLARYACPGTWTKPLSEHYLQQRQQALHNTIRVSLYTPGRSDGRAITLPIVPERIKDMPEADRQQTARQAAQSLGAMLGYGSTGTNASRIAILVKAIELLSSEDQRVTVQLLIDYLDEQDPALINAIGVLQPKLFTRLIEDLQTLKINRSSLFPEQGDPLDADALFGLGAHAEPGKTRLSIISTKFLGTDAEVQFWVSQLLLELGRWMSKNPSDNLQAVVLFDEADLYLPATSKPVTKEPMENLLKRARSAGLGLVLATQSPGDFDYKCRENLNTWFLGKIQQDTAIKKMQPLLNECKSCVAEKLPGQNTGEFFFIQSGDVEAIRSDRSVLETEQLPEDEILHLAQIGRSATCP